MDRPRNRQPREGRPPRTFDTATGASARGPPRHANSNVPTIQQVVPGASVSIVLKEDQPTGREVQGVVQNLLTRGNHPRGIKVRLSDGKVGRVQRMVGGDVPTATTAPQPVSAPASATTRPNRTYRMERDVRLDEEDFPSMPPPRGLADFMPRFGRGEEVAGVEDERVGLGEVVAKCPMCGNFEGDEIAVSRHVEEHLT